MERNIFLDKACKVVLNSNFVLYGKAIDIDQFGIILETKQKTSFIAYNNIKEMSLDTGGV